MPFIECLLQCLSWHIFGMFGRYKRQTCELHYTSSEIRASLGFLRLSRLFSDKEIIRNKSQYISVWLTVKHSLAHAAHAPRRRRARPSPVFLLAASTRTRSVHVKTFTFNATSANCFYFHIYLLRDICKRICKLFYL